MPSAKGAELDAGARRLAAAQGRNRQHRQTSNRGLSSFSPMHITKLALLETETTNSHLSLHVHDLESDAQ